MATLDTLADVPTTEEKTKEYTQSFLARIRSFHNDPLHSAAYLGNLAQFLHKPNQNSARHARQPNPQRFKPKSFAEEDCRPFVYEYSLFSGVVPKLTTFDDVDKYKQTISIESYNADCNELIFLAGRPSAEWLSAVGARYKLDHRFFHQHLSFLPTGQRDWFTAPTLPSRSHNVVRFCIPSLLFVGEHRYVNIGDLQKARGDCERQLLSRFRSYQEGTLIEAGKSIVRRMNIHSGDNLVIEQELSFSLLKRGDRWTVLVWTDSGQDTDFSFVPTPDTDQFKGAVDRFEFCPVFFEKDLSEKPHLSRPPTGTQNPRLRQALSSLPGNYGYTLEWTEASLDPMFAIQELFTFHAASELQYVNMLEQFVTDQISRAESKQAGTEMSSILHFDYARSILIRHEADIQNLLGSLDTCLKGWNQKATQTHCNSEQLRSTLRIDLKYLSTRIQHIIKRCEAGRSTIMSNASIEEVKRSNEQAVLVTGLTKATNRLTFIFLPISFLTSVFGMNFRQLGQGTLSIWLWVAIALPLLACCILLVESGSYLKTVLRRCLGCLSG